MTGKGNWKVGVVREGSGEEVHGPGDDGDVTKEGVLQGGDA
jgi:hypothetical protein